MANKRKKGSIRVAATVPQGVRDAVRQKMADCGEGDRWLSALVEAAAVAEVADGQMVIVVGSGGVVGEGEIEKAIAQNNEAIAQRLEGLGKDFEEARHLKSLLELMAQAVRGA